MSSCPLTLQSMIATILQFWSEQGCVIHQGYDLEVGAGTFNPATFLRALGPEPYKTAYVEPSRRPQDGRYGIHPNRLQNYHQLQVILKPVPENFLTLYTESLRAIGLDLCEHDIRFVHDDWENPTIGAWGLGWEVWLNGMEITQLTYFQAIGSKPLNTISGEVTYGIERVAMYLQKKDSVYDILWNDELTYGQIVKESEKAWSQYNFDTANVQMWLKHFEDFSEEAFATLEKGLPIPAYDFVIKASHAFNILDARGVISVTERTRYISRIRQLARAVADRYVEWRASLNYPLLKPYSAPALEKSSSSLPKLSSPEDFLLEIGSEELPAKFVPIGIQQLESLITKLLESYRIPYEKLEVFGSPRRLAVLIHKLTPITTQKASEKKGPPIASLFTESGKVSSQGQQFFSAQHVVLSHREELSQHTQFAIRVINQVEYLFFLTPETSIETAKILTEELPKLIHTMKFPKKMIWDMSGVEYARPIRWLVALYGNDILPLTIGSISASRNTQGHRQLDPRTLSISSPKDYLDTLRSACVIVSQKERQEIIEHGLRAHSSPTITPIMDSQLIEETVFLTEHPFVTCGKFSSTFCSVPKELLVAEMIQHQRYFPTQDTTGAITNSFVFVTDNSPNDVIIEGNEKALTPRLTDGAFLFNQDLQTPLETFVDKLNSVTYFDALGSLYDKIERLKAHKEILFPLLPLGDSEDLNIAIRYCKIDLVSSVVFEFPELQGIMGEYYLKHAQLPVTAAKAVGEHLRHITLGQTISPTGTLLSLLDRFDNIISCFILNLKPTSSHDPYALRRQSLEIITLLSSLEFSIDLSALFNKLIENFPKELPIGLWDKRAIIEQIISFIGGRLRTFLTSLGFSKDIIATVFLESSLHNPIAIIHAATAIQQFKQDQPEALRNIIETHNRLKKILASLQLNTIAITHILGEQPDEIFKSILNQFPELPKNPLPKELFAYLLSLDQLSVAIQNFLNEVHVACDDEALRSFRISLLVQALEKFSGYQWEALHV